MAAPNKLPLPRGWTKVARSNVLHAVSVAFQALTRAWGSATTSRRRATRLFAELDRAETDVSLLKKEPSQKDERWSRVPPRRRPHYGVLSRN